MLFRKKNTEKYFKFKSLKTYASTEWLADGNKKYRTVFDAHELTYLYVELALYNKLFDEEDWQMPITLKCFRVTEKSKKEEICAINVQAKVSRDEAVAFVREGWGNREGGFWTRGDYLWEAYINDDFLGAKYFYVETGGLVLPNENPYFDVQYARLYEGPNEGLSPQERKYLTHFDAQETRYVWLEFGIENLQSEAWYCEIFFYFYNSTRQLKGKTTELKRIDGNDDSVSIVTGWGSDAKASWHRNKYTIEIVFMDTLIAVLPFEVGDEFVEGSNVLLTGQQIQIHTFSPIPVSEENLENLLAELDQLIGLKEVKKRIRDYINYLKFIQIRKEKGFEENQKISLHTVFQGNPGTGKTTIARMLGKIYHQLGLLSTGKVHEVGRAELIGQYIGQTAPKVKEAIEAAKGGILFIDEAYALVRNKDDNKDYGQEVIETLVKEMSDGNADLAIVMAGYPKEMDILLDSNPGLKSRINLLFNFPDFLPQELWQIIDLAAQKNEVVFDTQAKDLLYRKILEDYRQRTENFGNARTVHKLVSECKISLSLRIMAMPKPEQLDVQTLRTITQVDVENVFAAKMRELPDIPIDEVAFNEALQELEKLIGLEKVKKQVRELALLVKFYRETGKNVLNQFSLHTIFKGNPGTGKTTVARILAKIYRALGILERGHLVECDRQNLVAGYVGQTAIKTKEKIDFATGGILFIDEAYTLNSTNENNDFGKEAVEVIIKEMEDKRTNFIVIAAGYPKNMDRFMEMNPGLKSRFDQVIDFEDFSLEQLLQIAMSMLQTENLSPSPEAQDFLQQFLKTVLSQKDKYFGNARAVRKIITQAIRSQQLRMAQIPIQERTPEKMQSLILEDLSQLDTQDEQLLGKGRIGFKAQI